jgi:signal transduction histidine kinase
MLLGDPVRLAQVLWNLLNNAAKYTPEGGRIGLMVERAKGARLPAKEVIVRVRDTGMGIPPEMLPRVFDLFTQMERTLERAEGGLGIGLTLVRRLVEMHGGTVQAFSPGPGQGSEFVIRLPALSAGQLATRVGKPAETASCPRKNVQSWRRSCCSD